MTRKRLRLNRVSTKTQLDFQSLHKECEGLIRSGDSARARTLLKKITLEDVPRAKLADFCNVARRVQLWPAVLRALRPIVRPKVKNPVSPAKPLEKIEYALSLRRAGAFTEAENLLADASLDSEPRALLARGFGHMHHWDYRSALVDLEKYLNVPGLPEYEALTAKVNRLACLNFTGDSRFEVEFDEVAGALERNKNFLLLANCLEIHAQFFIERQRWPEAQKALARAQKLTAGEKGLSSLYIAKWSRILNAFKSKDATALEQFRAEALQHSEWETLRDLDYYQTRINPENPWAATVYFGTPFSSFRERLEKIRPFPAEDWIAREGKTVHKFDPWFPGDMEGELPHVLLLLLIQDLYRPATAGEIFARVYSDQFFDLGSSPVRVRQLITRLRKWIAKNEIPLVLKIFEGGYGLRLKAGARVLLRRRSLAGSKTRILFDRFREADLEPLSAQQWATRLGVSSVRIGRLLREATAEGVLLREGSSRYTAYRLK